MKSTTLKVTLLIFLLLINYTSSLSAVIVNGDKHVNLYRRQGSKTSASAPPATSSNKSSGPSESSGKAQDAPSSTTNQQLPTPAFQTEKQKVPTSPSTQDQPTSPKSTDQQTSPKSIDQQPSSTLPSTSEQSNPPSSPSTPDQTISPTSIDQQSSPTSIYQPPPPTSSDQQQQPSQKTPPQQITNGPTTPQQPIETITAAATTASNVAGINQQQLTTSFSTHTSVFPGYNMTTSTTNSNGQVVSFETYIPPSTKVVVEQIVTKLPDNSASSGNSLLNNLKNSNNYYMFISLFVIPCIILCF